MAIGLPVTRDGANSMSRSVRTEFATVAILSLSWGLVLMDVTGINLLMPFIAPDLKLDNTHIGILESSYWLPFGVSSYLTGELADRLGRRKTLFWLVMLLFSLLSVLPALANSFGMLLIARLIMGLLGGPILPLAQSIIATQCPAERRGMDMGIVQNVGASVFGFFSPLLLVALATHWGWRCGFLMAVVPGTICAALIALSLRGAPEPKTTVVSAAIGAQRPRRGIGEILRYPNIWLCTINACLFTAFVLIGRGYMPLFFVRVQHMLPQRMGILMSLLAVSGLVLGVIFPAMADRIGRKPTAIISSLFGLACPLAALYYGGPWQILGLLIFIGWAPGSACILFLATIPSETVPASSISTAIGFTFAVGTLIGGFVGPAVAGWSADHWGLQSSLLIQAGCALAMAVVSLGLRESRPSRLPSSSSPAAV
jgi:ACS family hexuronate transporter-like MFS transporter